MLPPAKLMISNVPLTCPDEFLKNWIEARGFLTFGVKLIREASGKRSLAYVQLMDPSRLDEAARTLDGQKIFEFPLQVRRVVQAPALVRNLANAVGA